MGASARNVVAFLRTAGNESLLVVAPRLLGRMVSEERAAVGEAIWSDTAVQAPSGPWRDVLATAMSTFPRRPPGRGTLFHPAHCGPEEAPMSLQAEQGGANAR
jgi:hypothetical protein